MGCGTAREDPVERQLLAEIAARPDDDAPRLVYADRRTERGDPRGTFVRDQVLAAALDESDPRWCAHHARAERALRRHGGAWTESLRAAVPGRGPPLAIAFSRGWIEGVTLSRPDTLRTLERLGRLVRLRSVRLCGLRPALGELSAVLAPLGPRSLRLDGPIAAVELLPLAPSRPRGAPLGLEVLQLYGVGLSVPAVRRLVQWLAGARLRGLSLADGGLSDEGLGLLLAAGLLGDLSALELTGEALGPRGLDLLLAAGVALQRLSLSRAPRLAPGLARILERWPLIALDLGATADEAAIGPLLGSPTLPRLGHLRLGGAGLGSDAVRRLAEVPFRALTRLDLSGGRFDVDSLRALLGSPAARELVALELDHVPIGDAGAEAIADSPQPMRLVTLGLSHCGLTDRGIEALAAWPGLRHVTTLRLASGSGLGPRGLTALLSSPHLDPVRIEVGGLSAPQDARRAVQRRFGSIIA